MDPTQFVPVPASLPLSLAVTSGLWAFLLGACVGSFLNVVIARVPEGISIVSPRSRCPKCEKEIAWYDNIPLLSWLLLRARCRGCKTPISSRYPFVEFLIAMTALALFVRGGVSVASVEMFAVATILIAIAFIDLDTKTIPLVLLGALVAVPAISVGAAWALGGVTGPTWMDPELFVKGLDGIVDRGIGLVAGLGLLASVVVIGTWILRRRGRITEDQTAMGWGDPLLLGGIGAVLGWRAIPVVLTLASFQGALVGVLMLRAARKEGAEANDAGEDDDGTPEGAIPFGPFLALGALEVAFFGEIIFRWISGWLYVS